MREGEMMPTVKFIQANSRHHYEKVKQDIENDILKESLVLATHEVVHGWIAYYSAMSKDDLVRIKENIYHIRSKLTDTGRDIIYIFVYKKCKSTQL